MYEDGLIREDKLNRIRKSLVVFSELAPAKLNECVLTCFNQMAEAFYQRDIFEVGRLMGEMSNQIREKHV